MNIELLVALTIFLGIGICIIIFGPRIIHAYSKFSLRIFRIFPWLKLREKDKTEEEIWVEYVNSPLYSFETWAPRIFGILLSGFALCFLILIVIHS